MRIVTFTATPVFDLGKPYYMNIYIVYCTFYRILNLIRIRQCNLNMANFQLKLYFENSFIADITSRYLVRWPLV